MPASDSSTVATLLRPEGLVRSPAFSHVAVVEPGARTVFVGGQNAVDADGVLVGGDDVAAQTVQVLENLSTALAACGATLAHVIRCDVLIDADADLRAAYAVVGQTMPQSGEPPLVSVARVVGLAVPGALVELSAIAAIPALPSTSTAAGHEPGR